MHGFLAAFDRLLAAGVEGASGDERSARLAMRVMLDLMREDRDLDIDFRRRP